MELMLWTNRENSSSIGPRLNSRPKSPWAIVSTCPSKVRMRRAQLEESSNVSGTEQRIVASPTASGGQIASRLDLRIESSDVRMNNLCDGDPRIRPARTRYVVPAIVFRCGFSFWSVAVFSLNSSPVKSSFGNVPTRTRRSALSQTTSSSPVSRRSFSITFVEMGKLDSSSTPMICRCRASRAPKLRLDNHHAEKIAFAATATSNSPNKGHKI